MPNSSDGTQSHEECSLTPVKDVDNTTIDCIERLKERNDLNKLVVLMHGWTESVQTEWLVNVHDAIRENDVAPVAVMVAFFII